MFTFNYNYSDDDFLRFNLNHARHSKAGKRAIFKLRLIPPVCFIAVILIEYLSNRDLTVTAIASAMAAILCVIWILCAPAYLKLATKRGVKRMSRDGALPYAKAGTLTIGEDGIRDENEDGCSFFKWEKVERTDVVIPDGIYIYVGAQRALMLTNGTFADEKEKNAFISFLTKVTDPNTVNYFNK